MSVEIIPAYENTREVDGLFFECFDMVLKEESKIT